MTSALRMTLLKTPVRLTVLPNETEHSPERLACWNLRICCHGNAYRTVVWEWTIPAFRLSDTLVVGRQLRSNGALGSSCPAMVYSALPWECVFTEPLSSNGLFGHNIIKIAQSVHLL
jgi:hypothetical protein